MLASVEKEWKKVLIVLGIYTIWWGALTSAVILLQGLSAIVKQYESYAQFYGNMVHTIIKGTLIYYILIFKLCIPLIRTGKRKKILLQYLLFALIVTGYEYIWNFKVGIVPPAIRDHFSRSIFIILDIGLGFLMTVIAYFVATWIESNDALKREGELEKQKLNAELSAIKYQINPHFLFNSLSFIYTKTIKVNPEAAHAVHLLSEIMSYALEEWGDLGRVPLALEISHMKKVIQMNQIRFSHTLNVNYDEYIEQREEALNNAYVPTLVLITLVENAFKHGELKDEKNKVSIILKVTRSNIYFSVSNKKKRGPKEPSKGIGLSNVQQRLQLMYGDQQSFITREDETHYVTELNINLSNHDSLHHT
jgi:sensor histidine kinase YesM